ncbi:X-linked interleukin-1 receptor accessory protein-like 2 [Planococcus citri]|uniref:X-linked interleukin-1 receptor accessory protein-like 2 n=1 Tax=Planococcus citri TaxID=170843 RepID=UPI0031FA1A74
MCNGSVLVLVPIVALLFSCKFTQVICAVDFCTDDNTLNYESHLQTDQPISRQEFGIGRHMKRLQCCAKNYQSILWFKEGKPYPWKEETSNFIIDAKSNNQSIKVQSLSREDGGIYSCVIISADSQRVTHQISLKVFDSGYSGMPMHTFIEPRNLAVHTGSGLRLYCEAFVGKIDLPDAQNKINWFKVGVNDTFSSMSNNSQWQLDKIVKDDGLTLGLYLVTDNVKDTDLGEYVCSVSNAADQITQVRTKLIDTDSGRLVVYLAICVSFVVLGAVIYLFCRKYVYDIRACMRQYTTFEKYDDNKDYDVFILYEMQEVQFVSDVLIPALNNVHDYALSSQLLRNDVAIDMECRTRIAASRCLLLVLPSPRHNQDREQFSQNLLTASNLHNKVICLIVQENDTDEKLYQAELTKFAKRLTFVQVSAKKEDWSRLWHFLRLHLSTNKKIFSTINSKRYSTVNDKNAASVYML